MSGLRLYEADNFAAQVKFDGESVWNVVPATAWVETEGEPESELVTALNEESTNEIGARPIQTIAVGMDLAQLADPTYDRLLQVADDEGQAQFRVSAPPKTVLASGAARAALAAHASAKAGSVLSLTLGSGGVESADAFAKRKGYANGIMFQTGTGASAKFYSTKSQRTFDPLKAAADRTAELVVVEMSEVTPSTTPKLYRPSASGPSAAVTPAVAFALLYPGPVRQAFTANVTTGGALNLPTGSRAQTSVNLAPAARFDMRLHYLCG